jgi:hypothetical protein
MPISTTAPIDVKTHVWPIETCSPKNLSFWEYFFNFILLIQTPCICLQFQMMSSHSKDQVTCPRHICMVPVWHCILMRLNSTALANLIFILRMEKKKKTYCNVLVPAILINWTCGLYEISLFTCTISSFSNWLYSKCCSVDSFFSFKWWHSSQYWQKESRPRRRGDEIFLNKIKRVVSALKI